MPTSQENNSNVKDYLDI